jgi:hypothetical protein
VSALRALVPRALRRSLGAQVARVRAARLERDLARIASGNDTIVAGPWLGEVGFELVYWVPFLRWFTERFRVDPARMLIVSRGGTRSWYRPFASSYRDIFDHFSPEEYRRKHDERVAANGEQKQRKVLAFEHDLLQELTRDVRSRTMLHPSTMYELFNPFWWTHTDDSWVLSHARYQKLDAGADVPDLPTSPYTAVKFYFNDCFPATDENRAFVRRTIEQLAAQGPVVSLTTGLQLDDHGGVDAHALGVRPFPADVSPRDNLGLQSAIVARADAFVGTYGGFSYLAPFLGVRSIAYYGDPNGFSRRHLLMVRSALHTLESDNLLDVRAVGSDPIFTGARRNWGLTPLPE